MSVSNTVSGRMRRQRERTGHPPSHAKDKKMEQYEVSTYVPVSVLYDIIILWQTGHVALIVEFNNIKMYHRTAVR